METRTQVDEFLTQLPLLIRQNKVWPAAPGSGESGHDRIALAIRDWLRNESKTIVHAEGLKRCGIPHVPREYRGGFVGSWNSPDIALIKKQTFAIAIEVDRGRGNLGASIRTAMTKGSFGVLTGKFDQCHVLIFLPPKRRVNLDD